MATTITTERTTVATITAPWVKIEATEGRRFAYLYDVCARCDGSRRHGPTCVDGGRCFGCRTARGNSGKAWRKIGVRTAETMLANGSARLYTPPAPAPALIERVYLAGAPDARGHVVDGGACVDRYTDGRTYPYQPYVRIGGVGHAGFAATIDDALAWIENARARLAA